MVRLDVYDLAGRRVATIVRERLSAGWHELSWNGRSRSGDRVAAGIYVCRLVTARRTLDRKVVYTP
jgi:flagellar hook assembly protein FlgD